MTQAVTATPGVHYTDTSGTLNFAAGEETKAIVVGLPPNPLSLSPATFNVGLFPGSTGKTVVATGPSSASVVTVQNLRSVVRIDAPSYSAQEWDGHVTVTLTRAGNIGVSVSVGYVTSDGTATAGADYTAATGTVTFAAGQTTRRSTCGELPTSTSTPRRPRRALPTAAGRCWAPDVGDRTLTDTTAQPSSRGGWCRSSAPDGSTGFAHLRPEM